MRRLILAVLVAAAFAFLGRGWAPSAEAAPITCPGVQVAVKTGDWWTCVNPADNPNESGKDRNPNGNPNS